MYEIRYAKAGDLHIAYEVRGEGPLDLLYVPGFASHLEAALPALDRICDRLSSFRRVIVFDKRGTGLSDRVEGAPTLEERMDDVRAVLDAAGSERAVLYGVSEGGPMSLLFAATHPARVSHLVLYGAMARFLRDENYPWGADEDEEVIKLTEKYWGQGFGLRIFAPSLAGVESIQEVWARHERMSASPGAAVALMRMLWVIDVRDVLPLVRVPTLVLHRIGDQAVDIGNARYLAEHIPGAQLVELPGNDHYPHDIVDEVVGEIEEFLTGTRAPVPSERVLATVLFTDIVGSTERGAEVGDQRWRELLDRHDALVRRQLDRFRGREVKTTGDGFLAIFDGPARAIRCGRAIAEAVRAIGLEVRIGLHSGECELRGDDVAGIAVNIGQRVSALAQPGEVLVSGTVVDLVAGSGLRFDDRGEHALKGVPGPRRLYAATPE